MTLLALAPIALTLLLMLGAGWSAARAGGAGLAAAALIVLPPWGASMGLGSAPAPALLGVLAEATFITATIVWILWPALALHQHQQDCGALQRLRAGMAGISAGKSLQLLLVAWFAGLFFEGAAGFGTPVALVAPLLVSLGAPPLQAVVLALLGHAVGVSFGALGTPVLVQAALSGLDAREIAWRTAALHLALAPLLLRALWRALANCAQPLPARGWALLAWAGFGLPALALAATLGPELATLGGSLIGMALTAVLLRKRGGGRPEATGLARALLPYGVLLLLVLVSRWPGLREWLADSANLNWDWHQGEGRHFQGRFEPLLHPGSLLMVALLLGARLQGTALRGVAGALAQAARQLLPVSLALLVMLALARLMLHAGMIEVLQRAALNALGQAWPLLAPALGALGSFVTGSATASNVLFSSLQMQTAQALGQPVAGLLAAQSMGAAVGNIICPHNIIAGAATVGLAGREAAVLRRTVWPCLLYVGLGGLLVWAWGRWL